MDIGNNTGGIFSQKRISISYVNITPVVFYESIDSIETDLLFSDEITTITNNFSPLLIFNNFINLYNLKKPLWLM